MTRVLRPLRWPCVAALLLAALTPACALHRPPRLNDLGIPTCPGDAERDLIAPAALQCWFTAPHGRWRILNHQQHLEALVVEVEARDLDDAEDIARRLVRSVEAAYSEVLVYVQEESPVTRRRLRRVQWTRNGRWEFLDF